jgi:site-specific recombinase XerD
MHKTRIKNLKELTSAILTEMEKAHYCEMYIQQVRNTCILLGNMADRMGKDTLDDELSQAFTDDSSHFRTGLYSDSRFKRHKLCVHILRTYQETGTLDRPSLPHKSTLTGLTTQQYIQAHALFARHMMEEIGLKKNTIDGYKRFVYYFLLYCEEQGYHTTGQIQSGDVLSFLEMLCSDRYQPSSIGAYLPGLKLFFEMSESMRQLLATFPKAPKRKREIIPVLEKCEHEAFTEYLKTASLSARNRAICWLAFETGMRAVDISNLKITDIDWANDRIHVKQQKTSKSLELPLRATYGNAIADYLLYERPSSSSKQLFLSTQAPFRPLSSHAGYRAILLNAFLNAGILKQGRICGTRFTRHHAASHMLKSGVPLYDISAVLGHCNPSSVDVYLATDEHMMVQCCLPFPFVEGGVDNE